MRENSEPSLNSLIVNFYLFLFCSAQSHPFFMFCDHPMRILQESVLSCNFSFHLTSHELTNRERFRPFLSYVVRNVSHSPREHRATFPCIIDCEAKVLPALAPVIAPAPAMHQPSLQFRPLSLLFSFVHVSSFTVSRFAHNSTQHAHAAGSSSIPTLLFWPCSCLPCFIVVVIVRLSVCWQAVFSRVSAFVRRRGSAGASTLIGPVISLRVFRVRASACITAAIIIHPATHNFDDRDVINK